MPKIIGVVDGTHIPIIAPNQNDDGPPGNLYVNRKGYHSINVLVISDANLKIIYADARFPGSVHESAIWMVSPVRRMLKGKFTTVESQSLHIIGDSGFPLELWLLTPISVTQGARQRFLPARNTVERAFGVIKRRFRCLSRRWTLFYTPAKFIYAIFCINNLCTMRAEQFIENTDTLENEDKFKRTNYTTKSKPMALRRV